jgi:hypothetical protein
MMHGDCSTRCSHTNGRRHWNYLFKCNRKGGNKTASPVGALLDCTKVAFGDGSCIHDQIIHSSYKHDVFVFSGLIIHIPIMGARRMLAIVFNRMPAHDVIAWKAMIFVHAQCGKGQKA